MNDQQQQGTRWREVVGLGRMRFIQGGGETRWLHVGIAVFILFILVACSENSAPPTVTTEPYGRVAALALVEELERPVLELASKSSITREELELYKIKFKDRYEFYGQEVLSMHFDTAELDDPAIDPLPVRQHHFYPTYFHEGMVMTEAYVEKRTYEEGRRWLDNEELRITLAFQGEDRLMEDFERMYRFTRNTDGAWAFEGFSGTVNFGGKSFHPHYLEIKEEYRNHI